MSKAKSKQAEAVQEEVAAAERTGPMALSTLEQSGVSAADVKKLEVS